ncbi:Excinuclease ABC subunit C [Mariniradius saccharolyticus AK6]|uniref:Excinuclease ABC subunit C n=1 Tax=Mariniradius saccharolyticus AK6 TaxID=1239962 RepID=M7Y6N5_9BACT|nr:GIY-YIG nuclease family protein [Mariniradius saccharolyticus]EMS32881.1 Excinuclease ABC subunit C [Mariniradius saccharolyticus AK6]
MRKHEYFVYILTNFNRTVIYVGVTNSLSRRIAEHHEQINPDGFTAKYQCKYLVYYEIHQYIRNALAREKEIKSWRREKKNQLIEEFNPGWNFLNNDVLGD